MRARAAARLPALALLALAAGCELPALEAREGSLVPAYAAGTLAGETVALRDLRGEVVLLNVWATWCYPCRREMPSFEALQRELGAEGLRVVAVSIDRAGDQDEIRDFLAELGITFTVLHDPEQTVTRTFRTRGVPETFLIGRDGVLRKHWIGRIDGHSDGVRGPIREALRQG
jgi:cytochrome c biogenesis protein CcmG, thiol:disulfide interchange protein DsbE